MHQDLCWAFIYDRFSQTKLVRLECLLGKKPWRDLVFCRAGNSVKRGNSQNPIRGLTISRLKQGETSGMDVTRPRTGDGNFPAGQVQYTPFELLAKA